MDNFGFAISETGLSYKKYILMVSRINPPIQFFAQGI